MHEDTKSARTASGCEVEIAHVSPTGVPVSADTVPCPEPGRVTTTAERRMAGGQWLLAAAPSAPQALAEWKDSGATWLRPGPLFYEPEGFGREGTYVALVPASAALVWRVPGTVVHTPRALLLVPAPDRCAPGDGRPWWVVPLDGPGTLCSLGLLASLVAIGRKRVRRSGGELDG